MRFKFTLLFLTILYFGCTNNPFFSDEIKTNEKFSFSGNVQLPFTTNHSEIHVYVEGLDVLTKTDGTDLTGLRGYQEATTVQQRKVIGLSLMEI